MQKLSKFVMIGASLLTLAGCSTSTSQSTTINSVQTESVTSSTPTTNSVTNNSTTTNSVANTTNSNSGSQDLGSQADQWRTAFEKSGFTITDWDLEISFDAYQGQSLVEVEIQKSANAEYAFQEDQDRYDFDTQEVSRYQNGNGELVVLRDLEDNQYEIVAIDRTQGVVYSVSQVREADLQTILNLLGTLNLPIN